MLKKVKIAVDAMGGIGSPKKVIDGIEISLKENKDNFFWRVLSTHCVNGNFYFI